MKKLKINKKIVLIILTLVLIISISFNYVKLKGKKSTNLLEKENENQLKVQSQNKEVAAANLKIKNKNLNLKSNSKAEIPVEKLATIKEIKDPFKIDKNNQNSANQDADSTNPINPDELLSLEKNIIQQVKTKNPNKSDNLSPSIEDNLKLDFKLLGIIKNKKQAAALFLYQGKTILKKEKDKISSFEIKNINKKEVILFYQEKEIKLNLWEDLKDGTES